MTHRLATAGLLEHDLVREPLVMEAGFLAAPGGEGTGALGVALDEQALHRFGAETVEAVG